MYNKNIKSHEEYYDAIRAGDKLNCPNCGAPIEGEICQYCGTVFVDMAVIDTKKPLCLVCLWEKFLRYTMERQN